MSYINKIMGLVHKILVGFAKMQLVAMCVIVAINVFCRYVLNWSIYWHEEVALILVVWFSFIGMALAVMEKFHISIVLFMSKCSEKVDKYVVQKFIDLMILLFSLVLIIFGSQLFMAGLTNTLPSTGIPTAIVYAVLPFSGIMIFYEAITDLLDLEKFAENRFCEDDDTGEDEDDGSH